MSSESFGELLLHPPPVQMINLNISNCKSEAIPSRHSEEDKRLRNTRKKRQRVLRKVALKEQLGKERDALRNEQQATLKYKSVTTKTERKKQALLYPHSSTLVKMLEHNILQAITIISYRYLKPISCNTL